MAFELSNNETFFNGLINDANFRSVENELFPSKVNENSGGKTPRKPKSPKKGREKENLAPKQTEAKKVVRVSRKSTKEPLEVINVERKTLKKNGGDATPSKRKSIGKTTSSPIKAKTTEEKRQTVPKIIVYEDVECGKGEQKKKKDRQVSKSWEGRKSLPDSRSPKVSAGPKKNRNSFNDLASLKSPKKKEKVGIEAEVTKSRSANLKPDDPQFAEMLMKLEILFPGVDPEFLKFQFVKFKASLAETIEFILLKERTDELPTRANYMRRIETEKLQNKFLETFTVEKFLKMIPDPWNYFLKTERHNCIRYSGHSLHYLKNKFKKHYIQAIQDALAKNNHSLYLANKELKRKNRLLKMRATNRSKNECEQGKPLTFDAQFVHEVAFIENETKIKAHMKKAETARQKRFQKAQKEGDLLQCQSCNEISLLQDEAVRCPANHVFCQDCVVKYVEMEMEKNNFRFKCLIKCEENFSLESLQEVLSPVVTSKIIKRNQIKEIKSAGMEDLLHCPFCYYVIAMPPEMSVLKCLNPSCLTESCRHCKRVNHVPLSCHELEKFDKTLLDENETASPQRCIRCNREFVKSEDSNTADCPCGATMCSVCPQPFPECPHFDEPNGKTSTRLSCSSGDTEDFGEDIGASENLTEVDPTGNPGSPADTLQFLPSGSDSF